MGNNNNMPPSSGSSFGSQTFKPQPIQTSGSNGEVVTLGDLFSGSGFTGQSNPLPPHISNLGPSNPLPTFNQQHIPSGNNGVMRTSSVNQPGIQFGSSLRNQGTSVGVQDGFSSGNNNPSFSRTLGSDGFQSRPMSPQPTSFGAGSPNIASNMLDNQRSFTPPTSSFSSGASFGAPSRSGGSGFGAGVQSSAAGRPAASGFPEAPSSSFGRSRGMDGIGAPVGMPVAPGFGGSPFLGGGSGMSGPSMPTQDMRGRAPNMDMSGMSGMPGISGMSSLSGMSPSSRGSFGMDNLPDTRFGSTITRSADPRPDMRLAETRSDIRRFMGSGMGSMDPMLERMSRFGGGGGMPPNAMPPTMMGPMGPRMPGPSGMNPFMGGMPPFMRSRVPPFMMRGGMGFRRRMGMFRRR